MTTINAESLEATVSDAVGEILDERFKGRDTRDIDDELQEAIVNRVLKRLQMATYSEPAKSSKSSASSKECKSGCEEEHKMFDPIAGP